ncbi:unnamed protein product [Vicia faba]|uniref:Protein PGR n=1 Tax=Vicia faba TaxID=3906 RepID=A0AAV1A8Q7_VICFA|nr:unnamed protein product [Vicia faba]
MDSSHSQWIQPLVTVSVGSFIAFRAHRKIPSTLLVLSPISSLCGQRNWIQVLSNNGIASVLVVALWVLTEGNDYCLNSKDSPLITAIIGVVIGHYCCYNGDTWSSEIGVLSDDRPRLIIIFKHVRKEFLTIRCGSDRVLKQLLVIPIATTTGLGGSIIDSLFGATLQFSGFCSIHQKVVGKPGPTVKKISGLSILDNNAVNFVSILLTTILTSIACLYIF